MRILDGILDCVAFIGRTHNDRIVYVGTGFFVSIPSTDKSRVFVYFVTAAHVAEQVAEYRFYVRMNTLDGSFRLMLHEPKRWWVHPSDARIDVAVLGWAPEAVVHYAHLDVGMLLTTGKLAQRRIGVGDEVFMTGMFARHMGTRRNQPIARIGNIAMMPDEPIPTRRGPLEVYLIEARSLGGLSGSPVFVRETSSMKLGQGLKGPAPILAMGEVHLLGVAHGHWDVPPDADLTIVADGTGAPAAVNMGVAIVTPAQQLLDVLYQPELVAARRAEEAQWVKQDEGTAPQPAEAPPA